MQELPANYKAVFRLVYHLVLVTKSRRKVFTGVMIDRAGAILSDLCVAWEGKLVECSGEADHLHALVDMPPSVRVSDLVNNLKTVTSRRLRAEFPAVRAAYGDKAVLWSPSYCVVSAGGAPLAVIKRYIEGQQRPE